MVTVLAVIALGQSANAASNPPVGTVWNMNYTVNAGTNGELNVTWSVKLDAVTDTQITFRYTFSGEVGFITDQACNNPTVIPLSFNRVAVNVVYGASSNPGQPSPLNVESLLTSKPDYQAPTFVNCWNLANPPAFYSNAISYVRYQGLKFSTTATVPRSAYFTQGLGHGVTFSVSTNASPDGANFVGGSIPVPAITSATGATTTTTTSKKTTTTVGGENVESTTTVADDPVDTTNAPTDTTEPVRNAVQVDNGVVLAQSEDGVAINLAEETPIQEQTRKEIATESLVIAVSAIVSSLGAVLPAIGSPGVVGAVGSLAGAAATRGFTGGELLPQRTRPQLSSSRRRVMPDMKPRSDSRQKEIALENPFDAPQNFANEADNGSGSVQHEASRLFKTVVLALQSASKLPLLRPGLRRLAEVAVVNPLLAAAIPVVVVSGSAVLAVLIQPDTHDIVIAFVGMFLLSFLAPVLSLLAVVGWFLGRVIDEPQQVFLAVCESIALLPGLLIVPVLARSIIGPRDRSRKWEWYGSVILMPIALVYMYKVWLFSFNSKVKTLSTLGPDSLVQIHGRGDLAVSVGTAWVVGGILAAFTSAVAILAVYFSGESGVPFFMLERWIRQDDPVKQGRIECIECATLKAPAPRRWFQPMAYVLATLTAAIVLFPVLGWRSLFLIGCFVGGVLLSNRFGQRVSVEVHPIVKKVPMLVLGVTLGSIAVSPDRAFLSFAIIMILAIASLQIRTRKLWT